MTRTSNRETVRLQTSDWLTFMGGIVVAVASVVAIAYSMHYEAVTSIRVYATRLEQLEKAVDNLADEVNALRHQR